MEEMEIILYLLKIILLTLTSFKLTKLCKQALDLVILNKVWFKWINLHSKKQTIFYA